MPVDQNIYGTPGSDAVTYSVADVSIGNIIDNAKWSEMFTAVNSERTRRSYANISDPGFTGTIQASDLNALKDGINNAGYTSGFSGVSVATTITASHINQMIDKIQAAGAVCLCDCNYCTCNCNYCTCDCNYSCTCNCNYSDERLKSNIKFVGIEHGIRMYSWNYKWESKTYIGVIAQELVGTKFENALCKDANGYLMVDYSKLPVKLKG